MIGLDGDENPMSNLQLDSCIKFLILEVLHLKMQCYGERFQFLLKLEFLCDLLVKTKY